MTTLRIDLETYSSVDLRKAGVHRYVESKDFEILLFGYAFDDEPVTVVDLISGETLPARVAEALCDPTVVKAAYNAAFEIACIARHFNLQVDVTQWRCTSVHALYLGLPGNLADVGRVVGLSEEQQKLGGWQLIKYFCLPCRPTKINKGRTRNLPHHDPAKWQLFKDYCARDVETERVIANKLIKFPVPDIEWRLWHLDQRMNSTGWLVEQRLVANAIVCDTQYKQRLLEEAVKLTGLRNPNSREQLLEWLRVEEDNPEIEDLKKKTVPKILESTSSDIVRRMLEVRQELAKTSVTKYQAMARAVCSDGRLRGLLQYYGANRTGRWAGRLVQVQNLPSNKLRDLNLARELVIDGQFAELEALYGAVPDTLSQLIRTAFIAPPGHRLIVVDFSAIEARVVAWLAWCAWRLEVFRTHGKIYEASAEQMFKLPAGSVTKKSPYRQRGKVAELALGYGGGDNALVAMGALDMGLTEDELSPIKMAWRAANPEVCRLWYALETAAVNAVADRTERVLSIADGRATVTFTYASGFLFVTLPSGRRLAYVKPRIEQSDLVREAPGGGTYVAARAGSLTYEGTDQKTKRWSRISTWGGKLLENITQAIARDCLRESMLAIDEAGYRQITTVHDEIVIEAPTEFGSLAEVEEIMGREISWAPGLPLRGDGFETAYYQKEID